MKAIDKIVGWAVMLGRLALRPMTLRPPDKPKGLNKEREMTRRRRQIAKHGKNYWCLVLEDK